MMSKHTPVLFFIILIMLMPLTWAEALGIGPSSLELDLPLDGFNSTTFDFNSDGVTGELIIGKEDLPFRMEPSRVNMTSGDVSVPVELTFYGNETLEPGVYEGMVTFIAYTGGFVAVGIKIRAKINLLGEAQGIQEEEPEMSVEEESEEEPEAEMESESEEEPETESEHEVEVGENVDIVLDAEADSESQEMDYFPYVMGVAAVAALVSVVIWWKRR